MKGALHVCVRPFACADDGGGGVAAMHDFVRARFIKNYSEQERLTHTAATATARAYEPRRLLLLLLMCSPCVHGVYTCIMLLMLLSAILRYSTRPAARSAAQRSTRHVCMASNRFYTIYI